MYNGRQQEYDVLRLSSPDKVLDRQTVQRIAFPERLSKSKQRRSRYPGFAVRTTKEALQFHSNCEAKEAVRSSREHLTTLPLRLPESDGSLSSPLPSGDLCNLCKERPLDRAIEEVIHGYKNGTNVPPTLLSRLLWRCIDEKDQTTGREVHDLIVDNGLESNVVLGNLQIHMFTVFENLLEANEVFSRLSKPNVFSWSAIISAHVKLGQSNHAIKLYHQMQNSNVRPNRQVFVTTLQACSNIPILAQGKWIHAHILESGFESDSVVSSALIHMYVKCGHLEHACTVFESLPMQNVAAWNALIAGFTQKRIDKEALQLFEQMQSKGITPDTVTFVCILKACTSMAEVNRGMQIHAYIIESGLDMNVFIGNTLIDMYAKCANLGNAQRVLDRMPKRDVVTWNALIAGYSHHAGGQQALYLFKQMQQKGMEPNQVTFVSILKACSSIAALEEGRQIHVQIVEQRCDSCLSVGNTLIDLYAKCGSLQDAHVVFDRLPKRDIVTWTVLIAGYVQHGLCQEAFQLFEQMQQQCMEPTSFTFVCILKACSGVPALERSTQIHALIIDYGMESDLFVGNSLIDMYCKCGNLNDARTVFSRLPRKDAVTWSALISGYTQHEHGQTALQLFEKMNDEGVDPDPVTYVCILKACSTITTLKQGKRIYSHIVESGLDSNIFVGSTLIDMYAKCGYLQDAHAVFDKLPKQDVVTWSALIAGYAQHEPAQDALQLFWKMQEEGPEPNPMTFVCILKVCSSMAALEQGKRIHIQCSISGCDQDVFVGSTLIDMYARCGCLHDALTVFGSLPKRNVVTWNALMSGFAHHSNYLMAAQNLKDMQRAGVKPNDVTYLCLLSACSRVGLVDEGYLHFKSMRDDYGIVPTLEHFNSMVDLLGRAGHLYEAEELLEIIPFPPDAAGWTSLLSACKTHACVDLGRQCFNRMVTMGYGNATGYVLMSNLYIQAGMWEDAEKLEELRRCANAWKKPAKAFIEVDNVVHDFLVGDKSHPQMDDIYAKLKTLSLQMRDEGYKPCLDLVVDSIPDEDKEDVLCGHSEKLAIAFGLINMAHGKTIRVAKNLRMCTHCHNATKAIAKIEMREIVVADAYCVHHFHDGACSCKVIF